MPYCSKCGKEIAEQDAFCPSCGASLRPESEYYRETRAEKGEKQEKTEKHEKDEEKHEKEQLNPTGALIVGVVLIFIGLVAYFSVARLVSFLDIWPYLLILLGILLICVAAFAALGASKRNPQP